MRNVFILVFVFALAGAGTNAEPVSHVQLAGAGTNVQSVSGGQLYRPHSAHPTLCRRAYDMHNINVDEVQALVAFYHKNQTHLTDFGCRLVNRRLCDMAEGEFRMSPSGRQECFDPRGGNNQIAPSFNPLMFNGASIGGDSSAIQKATEESPNMNDFRIYKTPTIIYVGNKTVRVFEAVSAILFECAEVRSLVYIHNKDAPMPERAEPPVMLEVHEEGMCMSSQAVNTIVRETMTTGDAPLDLFVNMHTYDGCFGPYIEKYLRSEEITRFISISKSEESNRTSMMELWVAALNAFSKLSDTYTHATVYDAVKGVIEEAATASGVCVDPKMNAKGLLRAEWWVEANPDRWGEGFFKKVKLFLCDSEGMDVNFLDDTVSQLKNVTEAFEESETEWVKLMYEYENLCVGVQDVWNWVVQCVECVWNYVQRSMIYVAGRMHAFFACLVSSFCGNSNKVLVLAIAGVIFSLGRQWFRYGRMSSSDFKQKQPYAVRKRQSSWASFKQQLWKDVRKKFAAFCSGSKSTNATKTKANSDNWDPLNRR
jgi:hypothetical protein